LSNKVKLTGGADLKEFSMAHQNELVSMGILEKLCPTNYFKLKPGWEEKENQILRTTEPPIRTRLDLVLIRQNLIKKFLKVSTDGHSDSDVRAHQERKADYGITVLFSTKKMI
jgi:hypothetical protein